jgi:hypothetical protein
LLANLSIKQSFNLTEVAAGAKEDIVIREVAAGVPPAVEGGILPLG